MATASVDAVGRVIGADFGVVPRTGRGNLPCLHVSSQSAGPDAPGHDALPRAGQPNGRGNRPWRHVSSQSAADLALFDALDSSIAWHLKAPGIPVPPAEISRLAPGRNLGACKRKRIKNLARCSDSRADDAMWAKLGPMHAGKVREQSGRATTCNQPRNQDDGKLLAGAACNSRGLTKLLAIDRCQIIGPMLHDNSS